VFVLLLGAGAGEVASARLSSVGHVEHHRVQTLRHEREPELHAVCVVHDDRHTAAAHTRLGRRRDERCVSGSVLDRPRRGPQERCRRRRWGGRWCAHLSGRVPSSIFLDKNRRGIGKSQPIWTDSKMETPNSPRAPLRAPRRSSPGSSAWPGCAAPWSRPSCARHELRGRHPTTQTHPRATDRAPPPPPPRYSRHGWCGYPLRHARLICLAPPPPQSCPPRLPAAPRNRRPPPYNQPARARSTRHLQTTRTQLRRRHLRSPERW
jgi:hypothetical protein